MSRWGSTLRDRRVVAVMSLLLALAATVIATRLITASDPQPEPERDPGPGPTSSAVPSARPLPDDDVVALPLGVDLQAVIDDHPPGTQYLIGKGVHREQILIPDSGDVIQGAPGSVLSGARDISADVVIWQREDRWWFVDGQTQEGSPFGTIDDDGNPLHARPEQLFVGNDRWQPVASRDLLDTDTWYFDYEADRIWLGRDPATLGRIETSVASAAISNEDADDVTIIGVTVERYANRSSFGAIDGLNALGWQIRDCVARDNHGAGVSVGPGGLVEGCTMHDNGQLGLKVVGVGRRGADEGRSIAVTIRRNDIHDNGTLDFDASWEAGGLKIAECRQGVLFEQNWVHDNAGPGAWFDVYNYRATIRENLIEDNTVRGIFYELSYGPTRITENIVRRNGDPSSTAPWQAGIFVSSSRDVEVSDNIVYDNVGGGVVGRTAGDRDPLIRNLVVQGNQIALSSGFNGIEANRGAPSETFDGLGNTFIGNDYWGSADADFAWDGSLQLSWDRWQALGNDIEGSLRMGPDRLDDTTSDIPRRRYGATPR
ncbi:hypothetical protein BH23ACT10_BH23ACT10_06930 [soil metagenome]